MFNLRTLDIAVFGVLFLLASTVYVPSFPQGSLPKWEIIYGLAVYASIRGFRIDGRVAVFLAFASLSLLWSDDARAGALQLQKLFALAIICLWIAKSEIEERHVTYAIAASFPVVAVILAFDTYYGSFGNENFVTEWVVLCLPWFGAGLLRSRSFANRHLQPGTAWYGYLRQWNYVATILWGVAAGSGICYLLIFNNSRIEYFVTFVGSVVGLWLIRQRAFALTVLCIGIGGALYGDFALDSIYARVEFWINSLFVWLNSPLIGHGFGSFNYEYPRFDLAHRLFFPHMRAAMAPINFAGAAHNEYLQIMCELGVVGLLLAVWVVWRPWKLSAASVCLALLAIESLIEFPLQNPATALLGAISLGFVLRSEFCAWDSLSGEARRAFRTSWARFGRATGISPVRSNPTRR